MLAKFISTKLLVVVGTIGVALLPQFVDKMSHAIDWRIYVIAGGYIIVNFAQNVAVAWIQAKHGRNT